MKCVNLVILALFLITGVGQSQTNHSDGERRLLQDYGVEVQESNLIDPLLSLLDKLPKTLAQSVVKDGEVIRVLIGEDPRWWDFWSDDHLTVELKDAESVDQALNSVLDALLSAFLRKEQPNRLAAWRKISGWQDFHVLRPTTWDGEADNQDPRGYGHGRGRESATMDFITFGRLYFRTPDSRVEDSIKCRTPLKYDFFRRRFPQYQPRLDRIGVRCKSVGEGLLDDVVFQDPIFKEKIPMGKVSVDTVSGFELLYATPGTNDAAELAGHLLLRIKLKNNPGAAKLGVENPHDLVIAFLADTSQPGLVEEAGPESCREDLFGQRQDVHFDPISETFQAVKGLTGGLLTLFDRSTLFQTVQNYTVFQDRNLHRYKLHLTEAQKKSLLKRLYRVKKNWSTRYFFFDRNCASILVQVIGEGIGNPLLSQLSSPVEPPHSLISLMIRNGIASRVLPSFYSYRRTGHGAQEKLSRLHRDLPPEAPDIEEFLSDDDDERAEALGSLKELAEELTSHQVPIYRFVSYAQVAEMSYQDINDPCEVYSSKSLAMSRSVARSIISNYDGPPSSLVVKTKNEVQRTLDQVERKDEAGSGNTGLLATSVGVAQPKGQATRPWVKFSLFQQDMGSASRHAMQRAAAVTLGRFELGLSRHKRAVTTYRFLGLKVEKFRERLNSVPSPFEDPGYLGMSLKVLEWEGNRSLEWSQLTYGSFGGLLSIWSSDQYDSHLYLGVGLNMFSQSYLDQTSHHVGMPWHLRSQITLDQRRLWQVRGSVHGLLFKEKGELRHQLKYKAGVLKRFIWSRLEEGRILLDVERQKDVVKGVDETTYSFGVEYRSH